MNSEQWARVKQRFNDVLALEPDARRAWMTRPAADDPEVHREVHALLAAHEASPDFLEQPVMVDPADLVEVEGIPDLRPGDALSEGTRIGDYEIRRVIGRGGMGVVYLAQDVQLRRPAALKALPTLTGRDPLLLGRLRREAQAAAAVSHPGVAMVYAFLDTPHGNFIASEFIQGRTLREELGQGALEPGRAVRIAIDTAHALSAAHDARVVHRDLKPENVLLTSSGGVKVIDFGIARIQRSDDQSLTMSGVLQGTPGYMAPEQLVSGATVDARADIYALGVILAEMLLGHHPFERGSGVMPEAAQPIVRRCLESDPSRRYASIRDVLHDLDRVARGDARPAPVSEPVPGASDAMWWWQFHQAAAAVVYWLLAVPVWFAHEAIGGRTGRSLFFVALGALLLASLLRLHLCFTSRTSPAELAMQLRRERFWILGADLVLVAALAVSGVLVAESRMALAVLLLTAGVGAAVVALFIEPATTRAAVRE